MPSNLFAVSQVSEPYIPHGPPSVFTTHTVPSLESPESRPGFPAQDSLEPGTPSIDLGHGLDESALTISESGPDQPKFQVVQNVQVIEDESPNLDLNATHIKSSPYNDPLNFLNLTGLDPPLRLFAQALTQWKVIRPDYATAPYMSTFNWGEMFQILRSSCEKSEVQWPRTELYVVIFRSTLRVDADRNRLGELDQMSHQEACASGGLLHYWFGSPDAEMRNLATCVWRNREDAVAGGKGPWHRKARGAARDMYEDFSFYKHKLVVEAGATSWQLETYDV